MLVSVVIPIYNRELELKQAIKSVLNQTIQDFEILVVDDFSEINLKKVCEDFNDQRIKYNRLEKKGNGNICRNYGINLAQGKYVAMLDSDDEWLGNHIEKKIETLITKKADGVFGSAMVNNGTELIDKISRPIHKNETFVNYILSDGIAQTSSHFYKSECAKNILWSNELLRHQDYDYCVKFAKQYNFVPCYEITTIIHWTTGVRRNEHIDSMIRFIKSNKQDISLSNYINYHKLYHSHFKNRKDISHEHKNYFKTEILKNISSISLNDFMSLHDGNLNFIKRLFLRLEFIWRILLK